MLWVIWRVFDWTVWHAVFSADLAACKALAHQGACWGVVQVKGMDWMFGHYPEAQRWRPAVALCLWLGAALWKLSQLLGWGRLRDRSWRTASTCLVMLSWPLGMLLLGGWGLGLQQVDASLWGGLPLTLLLTALTLTLSAPLALALAWARHAAPDWLAWLATGFIELVRGAPLVMWLFGAAFVLPGLLPSSWQLSSWARVLLVTTVFSAAYAAEILRGSLATVMSEQSEASSVLGASWWQTQSQIVLPQVWQRALPPLTGHAIGVLKDTALVSVIGLHDLTGAMGMSLNGDAEWRPFYLEAYLFIAMAYMAMSAALATFGRQAEQSGRR